MILPEEDSYLYFMVSGIAEAFGIEPPPAIMGEETIGPKTKWAAFMDEVDADCDSRERAYQDQMRRG